jgi:predicted nuclease of restriction endonuclease-like (RecB) superfamily
MDEPQQPKRKARAHDQALAVPGDADYQQVLDDIRTIVQAGYGRAMAAVNKEIVDTYWRIGERIVQEEQRGGHRAAYGEQLLNRRGQVLSQELGRGFSAPNLRNMRQFYLAFPIREALPNKLAWTHYTILMRLPEDQREFYSRLAVSGHWSSRQLEKQIQSLLHERVGRAQDPLAVIADLPAAESGELAESGEIWKNPYILDFLGLHDTYSERDLEAAIIRHIEHFLLELGHDFCFVARQRRVQVGGEDFYIDLVFYHRRLRCLVLVDLKIGAFTPADAAQMQIYLEWCDRHDRQAGEEAPIGLILCSSQNEQIVELLLSSQKHQMRVAQYVLRDDMAAIKKRMAEISAAVGQLQAQPPPEPPAGEAL